MSEKEKQIKLIITDFDGVILDSESAKNKAFFDTVSIYPNHIHQFMEYHEANPTIGRYEKFDYFFKNILKKHSYENEKHSLSSRFDKMVFKRVTSSPFLDGAFSFLKFYSKIVPIWVVSGTPKRELERVIEFLNLRKYFEKIFARPPAKSTILSNILSMKKIKPENSVYFGDMNSDLIAAEKNAIPFIAVGCSGCFSGNRIYEIDNFSNIQNILKIDDNRNVRLEINKSIVNQ
mgnify:CR=1 FL=1